MRSLLFLIAVFCVINVNAQNYLITFEGSGESTTVTTVKVENLVAGTSISLNGNETLRLTITTDINTIEFKESAGLNIFPNPMTSSSILQIYPPVAGEAIISVFDITGKKLAQVSSYLDNSLQEFRLSGLISGYHIISVEGRTYQLSGKLISNAQANGTVSIKKVTGNIRLENKKETKTDSKGEPAIIDMEYTDGDRLKFTGISGDYSMILTDIPSGDKIITFDFIACTDGDNNNYPVVEIGTQLWMAENLLTTHYNDNTAIPLVDGSTEWSGLASPAYCWCNNEETNKNTYGALYNWFTVNTGKICPAGWHSPSHEEWTALENYLITNGFNYDGTLTDNKIAKSLASAAGWGASGVTGAVGNTDYPGKRNISGFTVPPGGLRSIGGAFFFIGNTGFLWSTSLYTPDYAWHRSINNDESFVSSTLSQKRVGCSVRCVRD
jgi:uncharacterized protein (TIGR02145 family)